MLTRFAVLTLSCLSVFTLASCSPRHSSVGTGEAAIRDTTLADPQVQHLDLRIRQAMEDWNVPGLAIAVVKNDSVWFSRGYGVRRLGSSEEVDTETLFGLLSPTKTFTATALAILVEDGLLGWDDRVVDHLPHFAVSDPAVTRELRVRDLVSNRSGYADAPRLWHGTAHDRKELVRRMADLPPAAPPGIEFHYNNLMFVVAGEVVEAVSGLTWEEVVERRIFEPLGMEESTTTLAALKGRSNVASPHARRIFGRLGSIRPISYLDADNVAPAGMIHTSVAEMAPWLLLHLRGGVHEGSRLLSADAISHLQESQIHIADLDDERLGGDRAFGPLRGYLESIGYGLGWFVTDFRGRPAVFHGGGLNGQRSAVGLLPEDGVGVVILSNMQDTEITLALMFQAFDVFLETTPRDWSTEYLKMQPWWSTF
jgi:CubicO group peptidase (beta-lactamase class C family)